MKPIAFRIWDFKSIQDSKVCTLSNDRITVLAGQNEAGKTSILTALRDFDLDEHQPPETSDYEPDHNPEEKWPRVAVQFEIEGDEMVEAFEALKGLPSAIRSALLEKTTLWIIRDLKEGTYFFGDDTIKAVWTSTAEAMESAAKIKAQIELVSTTVGKLIASHAAGNSVNTEGEDEEDLENDDEPEEADDEQATEEVPSENNASAKMVELPSQHEVALTLRPRWPHFIYFDSFNDSLQRELKLGPYIKTASLAERKKVQEEFPRPVNDFLRLANIDLEHVRSIAANNRALGNYLSTHATNITGHFLQYWKQKTNGEETVTLLTKHNRTPAGELILNFYVHDGVDQFADQHSRGFLWFLSFFLRLTSSNVSHISENAFILIDEPATYLHNKAQKDVLRLIEEWIVKDNLVLYSTHSPYLLPADKLYRVRLVGRSKDLGTYTADRLTSTKIQGESFTDALSPVLAAIGMDLTDTFNIIKKKNIIVEGVTDYYYLHAWDQLLGGLYLTSVSVFPGTGSTTVPTLASLFIGWGTNFCALLDRDDQGNTAAKKLRNDMGISPVCVVQPNQAHGIEDLFSSNDFKNLLGKVDEKFTLEANETPCRAIDRLGVDKVILARRFSELVSCGEITKETLTNKTVDSIENLWTSINLGLNANPL